MKLARKYLDKKFLFPLLAGFSLFLLARFFILDVVTQTSPSMAPALEQGATYFVKKIFKPRQDQIVLVELPLCASDSGQEKMRSFKRLVALPGDTVCVINAHLYINGRLADRNDSFLHNYVARIKTQADTALFQQMGVTEKYPIDDSCVYMLLLPESKSNELRGSGKFLSVEEDTEDSALYDETIFPYQPSVKWNKDHFGPLYIPKKGDVLPLDTNTFKIYRRIICDMEGGHVTVEKDKLLLNNSEVIKTYTVKQDYYFVTGDNFDGSIDSRQWGFVPRNKLKAALLFQ